MDAQSPTQPDPALRVFLERGDVACPSCHYNLRGVTGTTCPECGWQLRLELYANQPAKTARRALMLACGWAIGVNVVATFPFVNRLIKGPVGKPNVWWWLTTGWPSLVCVAGLAMLIGLIATRDRYFSTLIQKRWLLGAAVLLLLQAIVTVALTYRWWYESR